jgi:DNA-binding transcriptional ArsR family regulator
LTFFTWRYTIFVRTKNFACATSLAGELIMPDDSSLPEVLPQDVPVSMPELPARLTITSEQQFKALGDPLRMRIVQILRQTPCTARQLARQLDTTPGIVNHHVQVLEEGGFVQVVARRLVHNLVTKYYASTARIFAFDLPLSAMGETPIQLVMLNQARDEMVETLPTFDPQQDICLSWFPHARLSPEQVARFRERIDALIEDLLNEPPDPEGSVHALVVSFFRSPISLQAADTDLPEPLPE